MKVPSHRIQIIGGAFLLFAILLLVRLYFLQIIDRSAFLEKADSQYVQTVSNIFDRGSIFFSNSDGSVISAATLKTGYILAISPERIADAQKTYDALAAITPIDHDDFFTKAAKITDPYEELTKHLDQDTADKINALALPGVNTYEERWRYYPQGPLASQTLGFVGYSGNDLVGRYGIESLYDPTLERANKDVYVNFFAEIFSNIKSAYSDANEGDVVLTIEPSVQSYLEKELKVVNDTYSPTLTGGVVISPKTGQIVALGSYPTFDPNSYQTQKDASIFINPIVENVYEMGSIIKPLTMAAGLDSGTVRPDSTYNDKGSLTLNGYTIYNFDKVGRGPNTSMQEVLNQSLNTGAAYVALKMGNTLFSQYMKNYGLGQKTGIDLPHEASGLISNLDSPRDVEHATASFGQGIALTPIETARALASLANGGVLMTPYLVKEVDYKSGLKQVTAPKPAGQVISQKASQDITNMLVTVVDKALLNGTVKMDHYSIAAKTGTAQIAKPNGGGYYEDRYLHSFFGYFPAYNPQYLVFLFTVYPKGVDYASHTLTYPFIDMAKFLINYYQIPPDR